MSAITVFITSTSDDGHEAKKKQYDSILVYARSRKIVCKFSKQETITWQKTTENGKEKFVSKKSTLFKYEFAAIIPSTMVVDLQTIGSVTTTHSDWQLLYKQYPVSAPGNYSMLLLPLGDYPEADFYTNVLVGGYHDPINDIAYYWSPSTSTFKEVLLDKWNKSDFYYGTIPAGIVPEPGMSYERLTAGAQAGLRSLSYADGDPYPAYNGWAVLTSVDGDRYVQIGSVTYLTGSQVGRGTTSATVFFRITEQEFQDNRINPTP